MILITLIACGNVYADTCTPGVSQDIANLSNGFNTTLSLGVNRKEYTFTTQYNVGNVNYIKGHLYYFIKDTSKTITSNININATCTNYGTGGGTNPIQGSITYQDGTQASIDLATQTRLCQAWQNIGTETTTQYYEPSINQVSVNLAGTINNTNKYYSCDIDNTGTFKCLVDPNYNITSIIFRFYLEKSQSANINYGLMSANIESCTTDTQQIINNNNQNYNEFKNSDISNDTKQQPNQQEYNNAQNKENQMYNFIDTSDINILDIGDVAGWKWVLDRITEILNTHTKLLACVISILTIGVLKQLLGR